ncbi:MAG: PEGA domain-containing protein [Deltaproteobacteria bacterium]|nr:PEGA domain-containing protein [Deltaproteobacteria bacterium]
MLRFEDEAAEIADEKGWAIYAELHVVRAMSLLRLGDQARADRTLRQLAVVRPGYVPDPGFVPPKVATRYALLRQEVLQEKSDVKVTSAPAGAAVVVDGIARGQTPLLLKNLPFGVHHIQVKSGALQEGFRLKVEKRKHKKHVVLEHKQAAQARRFQRSVKAGADEKALAKQAAAIEGEVVLALVRRSDEGLFLALGKWNTKGLVVVEGSLALSLTGLDERVAQLTKATRTASGDSVLHGGSERRARAAFLSQKTEADGDNTLL